MKNCAKVLQNRIENIYNNKSDRNLKYRTTTI